jgi:hypothetical protein
MTGDCPVNVSTVAAAPRYPSYKSLDHFIDMNRLKSLDDYLTEKIRRHLVVATPDLFLNEHRLDQTTPHEPGAREVWLTRTKPGTPYNYLDLNRPDLWELTESAAEFSLLMDFIATLPFERTGRMLIIYDDNGSEVPAHRDHLETDVCHDFIWFRTNLKKPFYMYNHVTHEKLHVQSYSAWFDTVNQFHGSDAFPGLSFSIRVDGTFSADFRQRIPKPVTNLASTPALWAAMDDRTTV